MYFSDHVNRDFRPVARGDFDGPEIDIDNELPARLSFEGLVQAFLGLGTGGQTHAQDCDSY